jgi:hypothetical protein
MAMGLLRVGAAPTLPLLLAISHRPASPPAVEDRMELEQLVRDAMQAMNSGDPDTAREKLKAALDIDPQRPDLLHALGALELQRGAPGEARPLVLRALALLDAGAVPDLEGMRTAFLLSLATIGEAEDRPDAAEEAYRRVLVGSPQHSEALAGLGRLQLASGELDRGVATLQVALASLRQAESAAEVEGLESFLAAVQGFRGQPPRALIEAHRDAYCAFFDHHAQRMAEKGWIAEAARMRRGADGGLELDIPAEAQPYAGVRIDLVDPATGQGGLVGDRPMVVGLPGFEALARAAVLFPWPGLDFELFVSSQCPWDHLPLQIMLEAGDPLVLVDPAVGRWYQAGFDGRFGSAQQGRFHFVSPPELRSGTGAVWVLDLGRASVAALDALIEELTALHALHPLRRVILGRGHLPA